MLHRKAATDGGAVPLRFLQQKNRGLSGMTFKGHARQSRFVYRRGGDGCNPVTESGACAVMMRFQAFL